MIKRTLYFSNPTYLSLSNRQLCIRKPKEGSAEKELIRTVPNAYCLADDIMEPYRPYVDKFILQITENNSKTIITDAIKLRLLEIPTLDVNLDSRKSPLMVAVSRTTYSLYQCFSGEIRKIIYPIIL